MSKNKFIKKLLIAGLCAVSATAMIGATACKPDNEEPEEPTGHVHNYATGDDWSSDANGHWYRCKNAGHTDEYVKNPHGEADEHGQCPTCHYQLVTDPGPGPGPGPGPIVTTPATEKYTVNASDLTASLADGDAVGTGTGITAVGASTVDGNKKTVLYNGESKEITNRIKLAGTATATANALKFEIANDNSVIVIYAYSGSSTDGQRSLAIKDENFEEIDGQPEQCIGDGNVMGTAVFEVNAGTYYVGSTNKGINLYYIAIWEGGALPETAVETKEAQNASCEERGNIAYTKTNFGRYKNGSGEVITEDTIFSPATGHDYSLDETSLDEPTENEEGSIGYVCANNAEHNDTAVLPALNSGEYDVIDNDETLEEGQAYYIYAIPGIKDSSGENLSVTITADKVQQKEYVYNTLYSNILDGTVPIGKANATALDEGIKIYGMTNCSTEITEWGSAYNVTAAGNTLTVEDKAYNEGSKKSAFAFLVFDEAITSGVYKVTGSISASNFGNGTSTASTTGNWCPLQLIKNDSTSADDTFATLRTDGNKKLGLGNSTANGVLTGDGYAYSAGTEYGFEFIIDLDSENKSVTLIITSGEEQVYKETEIVTTDKWVGLKIQTADSADRTVILKNLVIAERGLAE